MTDIAAQEPPRLRPRGAADRRLAALAHGAGLLGLTVAGWVVAAAVSVGVLFIAGERRSPYLVVQAGQAGLYQLAVFIIDVLAILWFIAGFLSFAGDIPGIPSYRFFDTLIEPWYSLVQVIWGLTALLWPIFHVATAGYAVVGALRTARGRPFWYVLVGERIRSLAAGQRPATPAPAPAATEPPAGSPAGPGEEPPV